MKMKKFSKKSIVLMASLLLVVCLTVGGTLAYLVTQTGQVTNTFTPSEVEIEVGEKITSTTKSDVKIKNTGDTAAYIRAAVVITWQDADGNVYGKAPVAGTDYSIDFDLEHGWVKGSDGFYYWTAPVGAKAETGDLINSCTAKKNLPVGEKPDQVVYSLAVEIIGSAIQADGVDENGNKPIELAWGVDIEDSELKPASIKQ